MQNILLYLYFVVLYKSLLIISLDALIASSERSIESVRIYVLRPAS